MRQEVYDSIMKKVHMQREEIKNLSESIKLKNGILQRQPIEVKFVHERFKKLYGVKKYNDFFNTVESPRGTFDSGEISIKVKQRTLIDLIEKCSDEGLRKSVNDKYFKTENEERVEQ